MEEQHNELLDRIKSLEERVTALETSSEPKKTLAPAHEEGSIENLALAIANKAKDCAESESIQRKVLDGRSAEAKVLLCFYVSYKYFNNSWLTSRDVEGITSELGVKIAVNNASNYVKSLRAYLESGKVRRKGSATPCRLNRNGIKRFEEILNG